MTGIIIVVVVVIIFFIRQNSIENERQEKLRQKRILDEQKRKEETERKRLEELRYENLIVVFASIDDNGKPTAILKRIDNTYITVERASENPKPYTLGESLRLLRETTKNWSWFNETEYKKQLVLKERKELERQKKIQIQNNKIDFLQSFGIEYLYHMTHINNLQNILQNGLQSHNYARTNKLIQVDIADNQVNDRRVRLEPIYHRSIHDYVPLYFNPKNPMLYRRGNLQNEIVILALDRSLLYQENIVFTNGNAAANATSFFNKTEDLKNLNWQCINAEYWNDILDGKRIKCSEVLVFPNIPTSAIRKIFCNNNTTKQFIENKITNCPHIKSEIKLNLYFSGINNQTYTQNIIPKPPTNNFPNNYLDDLPF